MNPVQAKLAPVVELLARGRLEQARAQCQRVLQSYARDPGANALMSSILVRSGKPEQALFYAERAVEAMPEEAELLVPLGHLLCILHRHREAIAPLERAVSLRPDLAAPATTLAAAWSGLSQFSRAAEVCAAAVTRGVDDPNVHASHAHALLNSARANEGVSVLRAALGRHPDHPVLAANLANMMNYATRRTFEASDAAQRGESDAESIHGTQPTEVFRAQQVYGELLRRLSGPTMDSTLKGARAGSLRLGIVSPDLRRHSVAYFVDAIFTYLDRTRFELIVFSTNTTADEMTQRFRGLVKRWHEAAADDDEQLATRIRTEKCDIVIDLAGNTVGGSLPVFARRVAPVQITYCGYPNTTGLDCMDVRIVDSITDPPASARGESDGSATERLLRLDPCFLCYTPPADSPEPRSTRDHGPAVFASFNAAQKINNPLLRLWARVLNAVEGSTLVLKAGNFEDASLRDAITKRFAACGGPPDRLTILPPAKKTSDHLAAYHGVDIALDPSPYNGTTTTCEALWMGVPVVTLAGRTHVSRVGASLLAAVGLTDLIARNEDEYVSKASALASQGIRSAAARSLLRTRLVASPLCDGPVFARRFESAIESAFAGVAVRG